MAKPKRNRWVALVALLFVTAFCLGSAKSSYAQVAPVDPDTGPQSQISVPSVPSATSGVQATDQNGAQGPGGPAGPTGPTSGAAGSGTASINLDLGDAINKPGQSILIIMLITVLSVAPALGIMLTSFTRIIIVLSLTRNALGVTTIPPTQVLVGLALFLSVFIMEPTFTEMNNKAVQPYLAGSITQKQAYDAGTKPLKAFMLKQTRQDELALFIKASGDKKPANADAVTMAALVPAFILSEIKTAFIIGFIVFIPFLVIDIIVSSSLMSMGMMMLPPQMISLPFKLLLFVLVDGWSLIARSLLTSFN